LPNPWVKHKISGENNGGNKEEEKSFIKEEEPFFIDQ
jgi:hypothetical protein